MNLPLPYIAAAASTSFKLSDISAEIPKMPGVYAMLCLESSKWYVGQSKNLNRRMKGYRSDRSIINDKRPITSARAAAKAAGMSCGHMAPHCNKHKDSIFNGFLWQWKDVDSC
jgi:hypothetical protein